MTGEDDSTDVEPAWHERTSTVVGYSIAALVGLAIVFWGVSCVSQQFNDPAPTSQYYLEPSASGSDASSSGSSLGTATTTTETITSTSPPLTTDINPGDTSTTSSTSSTDTTTSFNPSNLPRTRTSTTYDDGRTRPRLNETRTLYPRP